MLVLWAVNSTAACVSAARATVHEMPCCDPSGCAIGQLPQQHDCCALQSNPPQPAVTQAKIADHPAEPGLPVVLVASAVSSPARVVVRYAAFPKSPPGANPVLRI